MQTQQTLPAPADRDSLKSALEMAKRAELLSRPSSAAAEELIEKVLELSLDHEFSQGQRKQKIRKDNQERLRQGVGAFLGDLIGHSANAASEGFMYRPKCRSGFSMTLCSNRFYVQLQSAWRDLGWIEVKAGYFVRDDFDGDLYDVGGKAERLRATPKLLELAKAFGITPETAEEHFRKDHWESFPIEVKTRSVKAGNGRRKNKQMPLPRRAGLDAKLTQVRSLNAFYDQHSFNLSEVPRLKRVFHNGNDPKFDYDQGGRLYCVSDDNYQTLKKHERAKITIDGQPTAEVDVSSSFPFILHHECGVPFPVAEDIYNIEGIERLVVKKIVVVRLGSEDWPTRWPKGFADEYEQATGRKLSSKYKLKDVVEAVKGKMTVLEQVDQRWIGWARLQYLESEAMLRAMMTLKDDFDVVGLPIHDSLLVPKAFVEQAKEAIEAAYRFSFGSSPTVKEVLATAT